MRSDDIAGLGALAGDALHAGTSLVRSMHDGIASRPFGVLGDGARPVRLIHDAVSRSVYAGVGSGLRAGSRALAAALAQLGEQDSRALSEDARGRVALAVLNGLYGDHLRARSRAFAQPMELRHRGASVPPSRAGLAAAHPEASPRLAVFAHGLFCDEHSWRLFPLSGRTPERRTYGELLESQLGFTSVTLRYNTGLHVSDNGSQLACLLDRLTSAWPVELEQIVLVGHSMGGLVVRSACHYGERRRLPWVERVSDVVSLGSPHLGADLEKGLNVLSCAFARLPETRAFAALLNARSSGIKDLRFGACVEEDWRHCEDPDEFLRDRCTEVPFLAHAHYYFLAAALDDGPLGELAGDLLVRVPSASGRGSGRGRRIPFEPSNGRELRGLNHMDLLNHPAVYRQLRSWIAG